MITDSIERCSDPTQMPTIHLGPVADRLHVAMAEGDPHPYDSDDLRWLVEAIVYAKVLAHEYGNGISDIYYDNVASQELIYLLLTTVETDSHERSILKHHPCDKIRSDYLVYHFANRLERKSHKDSEEFFIDLLFWLVRGNPTGLHDGSRATIHRCEFNCRIKGLYASLQIDLSKDPFRLDGYMSQIVREVFYYGRKMTMDQLADQLATAALYLLITLFTRGSVLYTAEHQYRNVLIDRYRTAIARV